MNKGFSLISSLVAMGLMGGLSVMALSFFENINFVNRSSLANLHENLLINEIQILINNPDSCKASFENTSFSNGSTERPVSLRRSSNSGERFRAGRIFYDIITIEQLDLVRDQNSSSCNTDCAEILNLKLTFLKKQGRSRIVRKTETIPVHLRTSTNTQSNIVTVTGCYLPIINRQTVSDLVATCVAVPHNSTNIPCEELRETLCGLLGGSIGDGSIQNPAECVAPWVKGKISDIETQVEDNVEDIGENRSKLEQNIRDIRENGRRISSKANNTHYHRSSSSGHIHRDSSRAVHDDDGSDNIRGCRQAKNGHCLDDNSHMY